LDILWLEEYSGQERGALNGVFSTQTLDADTFNSISSYIAGQNASLIAFYNIASVQNKEKLSHVLNKKSALEVKYYREITINRARRNYVLSGLQSLIGYGGFIHNFKNYVIRGDDKYAERVKLQFKAANIQIEEYRNLPNISAAENRALNVIKKTLFEYKAHLLSITKMNLNQASVVDIDKIVKVDDTPALNAIQSLRTNITLHDPDYW